jgi:hypothetical protein
MADTSSSPLLELPGELRNRIYRLCLVSEDAEPIAVISTSFPEPPLLSTCKEIREEASAIFYGESQFRAWLWSYDSSPLMVMFAKVPIFKKLGRMHLPSHLRMRGPPSWHHLEIMLRRRHAVGAGVLPPPSDSVERPERELIRAMGALVAEMHDLPSARVQSVIQSLRRTLVALDEKWADDDVV